jgi:hypothetical protein
MRPLLTLSSNVLLLPNRPTPFGGNGSFVLPTIRSCAAYKPIGRLGRRPPAGRPEPATALLCGVGQRMPTMIDCPRFFFVPRTPTE